MNLIQIGYFSVLAKHLNFTAAAKALFISQPSLSKQIAILENELGVRLFCRNQHAVSLTLAGKILLEEFVAINNHISETEVKVKKAGSGATGSLNIGCLETVNMNDVFTKLIPSFSERYPDCTLNVSRNTFKELREGLTEGQFDLIFTLNFEMNMLSGISFKMATRNTGYLTISKDHALAHQEPFPYDKLIDVPFIVIDSENSPCSAKASIACWQRMGLAKAEIVRVPNIGTLVSYLVMGRGVSIMAKSITSITGDQLKFYDLHGNQDILGHVCAWQTAIVNPAVSLFVDMLPDI